MIYQNKWRKIARQRILKQQGGRCFYCYKPLKTGTLEHIRPQCKGGTDNDNNLSVACRACNNAKGSMSVGLFRKFIKSDYTVHYGRRKIYLRGMRAEKRILNYVGIGE